MDTRSLIDAGGWIGASLLTAAYAVATFRPFAGRETYHLLNIAGCLLLVLSTAWHRAWPSAVANLVWIAIGGISFLRQRAHKTGGRAPRLLWRARHQFLNGSK